MVEPESEKILKCLQSNFEMVMKYGENEDKDIDEFKRLAESVCKAEWLYCANRVKLQEAAQAESVEDFNSAWNDNQVGVDSFQLKDSKKYAKFVKIVNGINDYCSGTGSIEGTSSNNLVDGDFEMVDTIVDIDPITKKPLENPVRNKKCGHIYGKASITEAIYSSGRYCCPILGCGSKAIIQLNDLVEDEEFARKLEIQRLRTQRQF